MEPLVEQQAVLENALASFERRAKSLGSAQKQFDRCSEITELLSQIKALTLLESNTDRAGRSQQEEDGEARQEVANR
jgi:hypothetical protein